MIEDRDAASLPNPRVLAIGPFPPFVGGAAKNTAIVCDAIEERGADVRRLATNKTRVRAEHTRSMGLLADRILRFFAILFRIVTTQGSSNTTFYLVPDGGLGVAFSAAYALAGAMKFPRTVVHHRSYNHLRHRSALMAIIMRTAPGRTTHVFLDPKMEDRFKAVYSSNITSMYVPNAATCDIDPVLLQSPRSPAKEHVSVGFLSNLVDDKGFDVVCEAFPKLSVLLGPRCKFLLAGRPIGRQNQERLERLQHSLGARLEYYGEVSGHEKAEFFRRCDVFVFPTRFPQEAQPNVLYEAMAAGCTIVSTHWAGVPWVLQGTMSRMIEAGADHAQELVEAVNDLIAAGDVHRARTRPVQAFLVKKADADDRFDQLLTMLLEPRTTTDSPARKSNQVLKGITDGKMKNAARMLIKSMPPIYRKFNRYRGWRIQNSEVKIPYSVVGGDERSNNYGAWVVPDGLLDSESIVYSFGVGEDVSFDKEVIRLFGCRIFAYDPTPTAADYLRRIEVDPRFFFFQIGLAGKDGTASVTPPTENGDGSFRLSQGSGEDVIAVNRLSTLMAKNGHERIDLLKMDIEGFEYQVIDDMLSTEVRPTCIILEFHHFQFRDPASTRRAVEQLKKAGYALFWVSDLGAEYGFYLQRDRKG